MCYLPDHELRKLCQEQRLVVPMPADDDIQPASIDLHLGYSFKVEYRWERGDPVDRPQFVDGPEFDGGYCLRAGGFALACTQEEIHVPATHLARIEGISTNARKGLAIEQAGFIDPGFHGQLVLELFNFSRSTIVLTPGMRIGQLTVARLTSPVAVPYGDPIRGSHYQGQSGAQEAYHE